MPDTMHALAVTATKSLDLVDLDIPSPGEGEVLVRVAWCGICGSDIPRYFEGAVHSFPQVLGHEFSGTVVQLGEGVSNVKEGARVAVAPLVPCGDCEYCKQGRPALCTHYSFVGSRQQGALADYVAVPAINVVPIPDHVSLKAAALVEPLTVAIHGVDRANIRTGASALVFGAGVIGLLSAMVLKAKGVSKLTVCDLDPKKLKIAEEIGAQAVLPEELDSIEAPEIVIETAGAAATQRSALEVVAKSGQVVYVGTATRDLVLPPATFEKILRGELTVTGSWMSYSAPFPGYEWTTAVDLIASGAVDAERMITGTYRLDDTHAAFDAIRDTSDLRLKLLYEVSGE